MTLPTIRYKVGNENNPADPWGRSELVIHADGSARLYHHFSQAGGTRAWTGQVDVAALDELRAALDRAGFPAVEPMPARVPDSGLRRLTVEADGVAAHALVGWDEASSRPGYAEAFDLLDAVIRQLSGDAVDYPTERGPIVHGATAV